MSFGLFCKSFRRDFSRFERLYASVEAHDREGLPFVLSVPEQDRSLFVARFGRSRLEIVTDERLLGRAVVQSWRTQQIVKFHAWQLGFADAFLMLDSDAYFIRDFTASDFFGADGTPRFVVSRDWHKYSPSNQRLLGFLRGETSLSPVTRAECQSLAVDARPGAVPRWRIWLDSLTQPGFNQRMRRIRAVFRRRGPEYHVMPGPVWTAGMHRRFYDEFLRERRLTYADLIQYAPWEYVWIAEWLLAQGLPRLTPSEPFFLHFDSDEAIAHARAQGFREEDFSKHYLGLMLASGHQQLERY